MICIFANVQFLFARVKGATYACIVTQTLQSDQARVILEWASWLELNTTLKTKLTRLLIARLVATLALRVGQAPLFRPRASPSQVLVHQVLYQVE